MAASKKAPEPEEVPDATVYTEEFVDEELWAIEPAGPKLFTRVAAEFVGAFALVVIGVGIALFGSQGLYLAVGFGFGLVILAGAVAVGHISGAHFNPAVTVGAWIAGRLRGGYVAPYIIAQVLGAATGGALLVMIFGDTPLVPDTQVFMSGAAMGYGEHSPNGFGLASALIVEAVGMALLVAVVLAATSVRAPRNLAPFAIGLAFVAVITWAVPMTNAGLNPARATASAIFAEPWALQQLWVFWVAPLVGAAIVGLLYRAFGSDEQFEVVETIATIKD